MNRCTLNMFFALVLAACSNEPTAVPNAMAEPDAAAQPDIAADDAGTTDLGVDQGEPIEPLAAGERGAFAVGNRTTQVDDTARGRVLDVEVWYPSETAGSAPITEFEVEPNLTTLSDLVATAGECPNLETSSARDAAARAGAYPLIVFSHCHACTRYSSFSVAEHLASWGYIVVAPDHEENTLFDELGGTGVELSEEFLQTRAEDLGFVLDNIADVLPDGLEIDEAQIGVLGHSFGSVSVGLFATNDARVSAAFGLAAPMENPLLPGVSIADLQVPLGFLVATEDHSIREVGNRLIRQNFEQATTPAWKIELIDAGHWSVSDLVGLVEMFDPGCGTAIRNSGGSGEFEYIDPLLGRTITSAYVLAFFELTLRGSEEARAFLESPPWAEATVESTNQP